MGVNKVILVGHLGQNPTVRHLEGGKAVATFSMATNESYKNKEGEKVEHTEWHNIVIWGKLAEVAEQHFKKGMQLYIEGKLSTRSYQADDTTKYRTEVILKTFTFCGSGSTGGKQDAPAPAQEPEWMQSSNLADDGDDLPF